MLSTQPSTGVMTLSSDCAEDLLFAQISTARFTKGDATPPATPKVNHFSFLFGVQEGISFLALAT